MSKTYTLEEVAKHATEKDCWVVINGEVINATPFLDDHPGGKMAIMSFAGRDATEEFNMLHDADVIQKSAQVKHKHWCINLCNCFADPHK
eukprot:g42964.t1